MFLRCPAPTHGARGIGERPAQRRAAGTHEPAPEPRGLIVLSEGMYPEADAIEVLEVCGVTSEEREIVGESDCSDQKVDVEEPAFHLPATLAWGSSSAEHHPQAGRTRRRTSRASLPR